MAFPSPLALGMSKKNRSGPKLDGFLKFNMVWYGLMQNKMNIYIYITHNQEKKWHIHNTQVEIRHDH